MTFKNWASMDHKKLREALALSLQHATAKHEVKKRDEYLAELKDLILKSYGVASSFPLLGSDPMIFILAYYGLLVVQADLAKAANAPNN